METRECGIVKVCMDILGPAIDLRTSASFCGTSVICLELSGRKMLKF